MKKKFYGALILGSLLLGGGMVSCSDYDDDINNLNQRVDAVEKSISDLKAAIEGGVTINEIQTTENGIIVKTSGGDYTITNGKAGSTVVPGDNGNWFIDGVDSGKPWKGEPGEQGPQGEPGEQGPQGNNGKDGIYYKPNAETGTWWKYDPNVEGDTGTDTGESYLAPGTITAVYDTVNGELSLHNVDGAPEGTVVIPINVSELQSIALIPEVYDKEMGMGVIDFYTILSKDSKVITSTNAIVNYRLNPNNASIKNVDFDFIDRTVETRAAGDASSLLSVVGNPERQAGGEITMTAKVNSSLEDLANNKEAIVALRAKKTDEKTKETSEIVSDYAVVKVANLKDFSIIDKEEYSKGNVSKYVTTQEAVEAQTTIDGKIEYDSENQTTTQLNLLTLVETWASEAKTDGETFNELGVEHSYKFTALDYTPIDNTNQKDFIEFEGDNTTVQINKKWLQNGIAAVGKTPIIKIESVVEGQVVATAYVKLQIVQKDRTAKNVAVEIGKIEYSSIDPSTKYELTWQRMNQEVLDQLGLTNETFGENYDGPVTSTITDNNISVDAWQLGQDLGTNFCYIQLNELCKTGDQKVVVTYNPKDNKKYPVITVTFTYSLYHEHNDPDLNKDYQDADGAILVKGRLVGEQWKMNSEVKEHFENYLSDYTLQKYHTYPTLSIVRDGVNEVGVAIEGTDARDQVIRLTAPLTTDQKDVKVLLTSTMRNGETCTQDYVVRFLNPYKISISNVVKLGTYASKADTKDLRDYVVITDRNGKVLYENQTYTAEAKSTYKLDKAGMTFSFELVADASFGDKLSLDGDGYTIRWDNGGNDLQQNKSATYNVIVEVPQISKRPATGNITVLSTENTK